MGIMSDRKWVLLKRRGKENSFTQSGPYDTSQIRRFLEEGLCSDRDFVWTEGFTEWKRISLTPVFSTHPARTIEDILAYQSRKYTARQFRIVRYLPDRPFPGWFELNKAIQDFYS